jgi:hypothetical protein
MKQESREMTDFEIPSPNPPEPEYLAPPPFPWERPPRKPLGRWVWIALGVGLALAGFIAVGMLIFGIQAFTRATAGQNEVRTTLNQFLNLLAEHKESDAYDLFSAHARLSVSLDKLKSENAGSGFQMVEGYRRVEISRFELKKSDGDEAGEPQGEYAEVTGWITYDHRDSRRFQATFEHEGDTWRLYGINISAHPDVIS